MVKRFERVIFLVDGICLNRITNLPFNMEVDDDAVASWYDVKFNPLVLIWLVYFTRLLIHVYTFVIITLACLRK